MLKTVSKFLICMAVGLSSATQVAAQAPADGSPPEESSPSPTPTASGVGVYPPMPYELMRIRGHFIGDPKVQRPVTGHYFSLWCLVPVLGLFALWAWSLNWVDDDATGLKVRPEYWNSMILFAGFAGFIAVLSVPMFLLGFVSLLLFYGVPVGLYINERNQRVPEASKVMTPRHIRGVLIRALAQMGITIGSKEVKDEAIGPPIKFIGKSTAFGQDEDRSRQVESSKGFLAAKELVYDAIKRRSTDVHLEPKDHELSVRLRIDGIMYPTDPFDRVIGDAVINIFKVLGAMDITEKRRPQDGSFRAELEDREIDFRAATQGTRHGEKMSLRILDQSNSVTTLKGLGLRKQLLERLREVVHQPHGLFLSCGPTGAGKSTTLYAALGEIDAYQSNIITVEDPVEYKMNNINQIEINTKSGQTFGTSLRSILRQDPDIVMIGEIRDSETANVACQAANTGHMVFSTVHANDTITALYRMLELDVEPFMVANSISAILGQRLARKLCQQCRQAYRPKAELLKKLGLPAEKVKRFFRPPKNPEGICTACSGLGYSGRTGVFEMLDINERMRDLIREKAPMPEIKAEARKNGMLYMREEGLRLLVRGATSIEELMRVVK